MGGTPCKTKIILNGARTQSNLEHLCYAIQEEGVTIPDDAGYEIVEQLNIAEDATNRATRLFLESQGFTGPFDHSLNIKGEYKKS
jgi:hypothetical protein